MPAVPGDFVRPLPELALGALAVWRLTHLLHAEHGPWGVLARGRAAAARLGLGEGVACFWCLSVGGGAGGVVGGRGVGGAGGGVARALGGGDPDQARLVEAGPRGPLTVQGPTDGVLRERETR